MTDLLVIVPTKGRPHNIPRLVEAIRATAAEPVDIMLVVCIAEVEAYHAVTRSLQTPEDELWTGIVPDGYTYPEKLNAAALIGSQRHRYLALWNDDHVPETPGWDVILKSSLAGDPFGVAYANDGIWTSGQVPTAPIITSSMVRALGWVALPGLHHILVDNVWKELAEDCGTLHWFPDVMVRHHHYTHGLSVLDETYKQTSDGDKANQDAVFWEEWQDRPDGRVADAAKLRALWTEGSEWLTF